MSDKIDMSLDDIIKKTKPGRGGGAKRGRGAARGGRGAAKGGRSPVKRTASRGAGRTRGAGRRTALPRGGPRRAEGSWKHDLYDGPRRGGIASSGGPGTLVVSNLEFGVSDSDIQELFSEFGHLKKAAVHYDRSGRSLGTADVVFDRKADAVKAMKQYNGVPLDGRPMSIQLVGAGASDARSPARSSAPPARRRGTDPRRRASGGRVEKRRSTGGSPRGGAKGARGAKGGRGKAAGGRAKKGPAPTAEELDKELDSYLKAR